MNREHTKLERNPDCLKSSIIPGSPAERIALIWPLTEEVSSLSKKHDAERRLQRHVTRLIRNKRTSGRTKDIADAEALEEIQKSCE